MQKALDVNGQNQPEVKSLVLLCGGFLLYPPRSYKMNSASTVKSIDKTCISDSTIKKNGGVMQSGGTKVGEKDAKTRLLRFWPNKLHGKF